MKLNKNILGWMFYDFANSSFTTIIVTVVYSSYFIKSVVGGTIGYGEMLWGRCIGISMSLVALTAPIFGAVADFSRAKKKFLFYNCWLTVIFTFLLCFVRSGNILKGMIFFIIANYGFNSANVFYDAFLPELATKQNIGKISGYGWAFGYVGGLISLIISLFLIKINIRLVFPMIAIFFLVFSLVTFFWLKEVHRPSKRTNYLKTAYQRIRFSLMNIRKIPQLLKYLISFFIYNDGITTVIVFASVYGINQFNMTTNNMIVYFIIAQVSSIIGSVVFGLVTDRIGIKQSLSCSLMIWIVVVVWAFFCRTAHEYYFVGVLAGLAIGSSQSNSRTMLSLLTPENKVAEFFGFFTLTGRLSSILGPLLYGIIANLTGSARYSIISLIVFFVTGLIILQTVKLDLGISDAKQLALQSD